MAIVAAPQYGGMSLDGLSVTSEKINDLEKELEGIKEEVAEAILLGETPKQVDVYKMSYEEYMELPGNVRL